MTAWELIRTTLERHGVTLAEFHSQSTDARITNARRVIILALKERGLHNRVIARLIRCHLHTVRYWLNPDNREKRLRYKQSRRVRGNRMDTARRNEILQAYVEDTDKGTALAIGYGLAPLYAYKLANAMGAIPRKGEQHAA